MKKILIVTVLIFFSVAIFQQCDLEGDCLITGETYFTKVVLPDSVIQNSTDTFRFWIQNAECLEEVNVSGYVYTDTTDVHAYVTTNSCDCPPLQADTTTYRTFKFEDKGVFIYRYLLLLPKQDSFRLVQDTIVVY